jgi:UDP-N-acetylglucosamine transferase subunit ALG13
MSGGEPSDCPIVHLVASGGGHLELLSWLHGALGGYRRVWVVSPGARASALVGAGESVHQIPNPGRSLSKVRANLRAALAAIRRDRPRLIITSGAGSIVPYVVLARLLGARVIFIETTARVTNASKSGRVLSRVASSVIVQWPELTRVYPGSTVCRAVFLDQASYGRAVGNGTFVAVGTHSEPFDRLLELVDDAVERGLLPGPVVAQTGVSGYRPQHYAASPWLPPAALTEAVTRARYVVCHAGSGIMLAALRAGHRPLVLPRLGRHHEHFDDHQRQLANRLAELGLIVALDGPLTAAHLRAADAGPAAPRMPDLPSLDDAVTSALAEA